MHVALRVSVLAVLTCTPFLDAQSTCRIDSREPSEAEVALYRQEYGSAGRLFGKVLASNVRDAEARAGAIRARAGDGKFKEARELAEAFVAAQPTEILAYITRADVLSSQLQLDRAAADIRKALSMDPCNGQAIFIAAIIERRNEKRSSSWSHLQLAHKLSPNDDDVTRAWMWSIPSVDRYAELERYAATTKFMKAADLEDFKGEIIESKAAAVANCTVSAPKGGTTVPLQHASDTGWLQTEVRFGEVKRNFGVAAGGDGILLYEDTAKALGLKVGEHFSGHSLYVVGTFRYWTTTVPHFRIGDVEFSNCAVSIQEHTAGSGFGVIGLGVFRDFLVDFDPAGTLTLSKLPPLPSAVPSPEQKWSILSDSSTATRSRTQGIWQPADSFVLQGWSPGAVFTTSVE